MPGATRYIRKTFHPILASLLFTTLLTTPPAQGAPSLIASYRSASPDADTEFAPPAPMSPDGRQLIFSEAIGGETTALRLLDLTAGAVRKIRPRMTSIDNTAIAWRSDSRRFTVAGDKGIVSVSRNGSILSWRHRQKKMFGDDSGTYSRCEAWSPSLRRFAVFNSYGYWTIWKSGVTRKMPDWMRATKAPNYAAERTLQCVWSPDEKHLLLRYYGMSGERTFASSTHIVALDTRTGRPTRWASESGPPAWIDNQQVFYRYDYGHGGPCPLVLANAITGHEETWMKDAVAYAVSTDRKTVYATDMHGTVYTSPTSHRLWKQIYRLNENYPEGRYAEWTLAAMPNGFVACLGAEVKEKMHYALTAWRSGKVVDRYATPATTKLIGWSPARKAFIFSSDDDTRCAIRAFGALR